MGHGEPFLLLRECTSRIEHLRREEGNDPAYPGKLVVRFFAIESSTRNIRANRLPLNLPNFKRSPRARNWSAPKRMTITIGSCLSLSISISSIRVGLGCVVSKT